MLSTIPQQGKLSCYYSLTNALRLSLEWRTFGFPLGEVIYLQWKTLALCVALEMGMEFPVCRPFIHSSSGYLAQPYHWFLGLEACEELVQKPS